MLGEHGKIIVIRREGKTVNVDGHVDVDMDFRFKLLCPFCNKSIQETSNPLERTASSLLFLNHLHFSSLYTAEWFGIC
jgi:hypothetical protein